VVHASSKPFPPVAGPELAGLRVVIDARVEYGRAGGVQQGIVALAAALGAENRGAITNEAYLTLGGLDGWVRDAVGAAEVIPTEPSDVARLARHLRANALGRVALRAARSFGGPKASTTSTGRFESLGADVVHFPTQRAEGTTVPYVYQPWDLQHRRLPEMFGARERAQRDAQYGAFCRGAAVVVVPTALVARDVVAAYDVDPARVMVIAPWAPSVLNRATRRREEIAQPYLLYPAQAWLHKNHERLIDAVASLVRDGTDVRVICPGATNERVATLRRRVERAGLAARISFPGYVDDATMDRLYAGARGVIFPSLFEGWGYPVVEAMDRGVPVACSFGEFLDDAAGDAASRFDPTDVVSIAAAIDELWSDDALRSRLEARGRARVQALRWSDIGQAYRVAYVAAARS
jgi:glycosyltransferase involved in cell wall biosynthesis